MSISANPAGNPNDEDSLAGAFRLILTKFLQGEIDDMLPCQVLDFNRTAMPPRVQVQPMITMVDSNDNQKQRSSIASVPAPLIGGGNFMIGFPIKKGDFGFIKSNDRDISLFMQGFTQAPPNTEFFHSFSNGVFIPAVLAGYVLASEDANNLVIQSIDGTEKIAFWPNYIKMITKGFGIGGNPAAGAILDVQSTTQAFVPPRMTTSQKNAIPSPQQGFMVYDTTEGGISVYGPAGWS